MAVTAPPQPTTDDPSAERRARLDALERELARPRRTRRVELPQPWGPLFAPPAAILGIAPIATQGGHDVRACWVRVYGSDYKVLLSPGDVMARCVAAGAHEDEWVRLAQLGNLQAYFVRRDARPAVAVEIPPNMEKEDHARQRVLRSELAFPGSDKPFHVALPAAEVARLLDEADARAEQGRSGSDA